MALHFSLFYFLKEEFFLCVSAPPPRVMCVCVCVSIETKTRSPNVFHPQLGGVNLLVQWLLIAENFECQACLENFCPPLNFLLRANEQIELMKTMIAPGVGRQGHKLKGYLVYIVRPSSINNSVRCG